MITTMKSVPAFATQVFKSLTAIALFTGCQTTASKLETADSLEIFEFKDLPKIENSDITLGGFSGLTLVSNRSGLWTFRTHTDRGPNLDALPLEGTDQKLRRPFILPSFQPRWIEFTFDAVEKSLRLDRQILLTNKGRKLSGMPNKFDGTKWDELPVDKDNKPLKVDLMGLDAEALVRADDGTYWMADEYRPSLVQFSDDGKLLRRLVPEGSPPGTGTPSLPAFYLNRRANAGFEGIAYREGVVYGLLQSSLKNEEGFTHILAVDAKTGNAKADYLYRFEPTPEGKPKADKIGDGVALPDGSLLLVEQNTEVGSNAVHAIYRARLKGNGEFVEKELVVDLVALGLSRYEKVEGLTLVDRETLAVVVDNDFALDQNVASAFIVVHLGVPLY